MDTITPQQHIDWAVERALQLYDSGDKMQAVTSFISDVSKHRGTVHIRENPLTFIILLDGAEKGRDGFKAAMTGFAL